MTTPLTFSANTGFLYPDLDFLERVRAAARDGFDAVEFHDEAQRCDRSELLDVLGAAGLPVAGLNVHMGPTAGCAAIPAKRDRARRDIEAAAELADAVDAGAIHVLAGKCDAAAAREVFIENLRYALEVSSRVILIEPLCSLKMPDYWLNSLDVAASLCDEIDHPRLRILFDCFHIETEHGNVAARIAKHAAQIGHVQIASVPARAEPGSGDDVLPWPLLLEAFREAGYRGPFGCEYAPSIRGVDAFAWRETLRNVG